MEEIDYKGILSDFIWHQYIFTKNDFCGKYEIIGDATSYNRGDIYKQGSILWTDPRIFSYSIPEVRPLRWSELALKLGIDIERYINDGHNCADCPHRKKCKAHFKNNDKLTQPQCGWWQQNVDDTIYKANLEKYKNATYYSKCLPIMFD